MNVLQRIRHHDLTRLLTYLQPNIPAYIGLLVINTLIVGILWNIILAFILKDVIDSAVQGEWSSLQRAFGFASLSFFLGVPAGCYVQYRINVYTRRTLTHLREQVFERVLNMPLEEAEGKHSGDLLSRLTNDLGGLYEFYQERVGGLIFLFIYGLIGVGAIIYLDWRLGLISLLLGFVTARINIWFIPMMRELSDAIQASLGQLTERLVDLVQSIRVTKLFQIEPLVHQQYADENNALAEHQLKRARLDALLGTVDFVFGKFKSVGLLALGLTLLLNGYAIEVGTIAAIIYLQGIADYVFRDFGNLLTELQKSLAGARRALAILDAPVEPYSYSPSSITKHADSSKGMIVAYDLYFDYGNDNGATVTALAGIDLHVGKNHMAALVGPSGGGKSTLLKLLLGFYPPKEGTLTVADLPVDSYSLTELRDEVAYVPQEAYLFAGTIAENIRYGKPNASEDEVTAAARAANAHVFILDQPNGYSTLVGERGANLSGGQRQRIAIARALLKDAPILLLDEATSALDSESERLVQDALSVLMKGRTTIAVAHRLSTIKHADCIYVMDKGAIVEEGSHKELLESDGLYHQLYHAQFRTDSVNVAQAVPLLRSAQV